jgi:two-component sensor histidine kinase
MGQVSVQWQDLTVGDHDALETACDLDRMSNRKVRNIVRGLLSGRSGVQVDDAVQVVDELVSNASRHGHAPRWCRIALLDEGRRLRIEVDDAAPGMPRARPPDDTGGRGLILVNELATAWGVQRHSRHKTVWAEVTVEGRRDDRRTPYLRLQP